VALCIMAYVVVLWIELSPALLEKWSWPPAKRISAFLDRALIWIVALGMLLPTMHQSSLGSLMLLAGPKLHALWNSPFLPLFFLITCVAMGYSMVVFESTFSSIAFKRKLDTALLVNLQKIAAAIGVVFVAARLLDLAVRGRFAYAFGLDVYGIFFWIENVLFLLPILMTRRTANLGMLFRSAVILAVAGALYRFDTYLLAFDSGPGWHYFPSVAEILITVGLVAFELAIYIALVKRFPILSGAAPAPAH
jgi:Ni/Fe-hydrogenase subunit HybB-like protein